MTRSEWPDDDPDAADLTRPLDLDPDGAAPDTFYGKALRDRFAMAALTGLLAAPGVYAFDEAAERAYAYARAMMRERMQT